MKLVQHYFVDWRVQPTTLDLAKIVVGMEYVTLGGNHTFSMMYAYLMDICAGLAWLAMARHWLRG